MQFIEQFKFSNEYRSDDMFDYTHLTSSSTPISLDEQIPFDLNEFYCFINNNTVNMNFKMFDFKSYSKLLEDYNNQHNKNTLHIGDIYQGMGYYVALYYDFYNNYYFFMEQGGSCGVVRYENEKKLRNKNTIPKNKQFASFSDCVSFINDIDCKYYDDIKFLQSEVVIR